MVGESNGVASRGAEAFKVRQRPAGRVFTGCRRRGEQGLKAKDEGREKARTRQGEELEAPFKGAIPRRCWKHRIHSSEPSCNRRLTTLSFPNLADPWIPLRLSPCPTKIMRRHVLADGHHTGCRAVILASLSFSLTCRLFRFRTAPARDVPAVTRHIQLSPTPGCPAPPLCTLPRPRREASWSPRLVES